MVPVGALRSKSSESSPLPQCPAGFAEEAAGCSSCTFSSAPGDGASAPAPRDDEAPATPRKRVSRNTVSIAWRFFSMRAAASAITRSAADGESLPDSSFCDSRTPSARPFSFSPGLLPPGPGQPPARPAPAIAPGVIIPARRVSNSTSSGSPAMAATWSCQRSTQRLARSSSSGISPPAVGSSFSLLIISALLSRRPPTFCLLAWSS